MSDKIALRRSPHVLTALIVVLLAGGCGSSAPMRSDLFYSLDPDPLESPVGAPLPGTLLVSDLAARGFLGGRQIVFRTEAEPLQVQRTTTSSGPTPYRAPSRATWSVPCVTRRSSSSP
jgi:cholesterol transport system auxiliary component